MNRRGLHTLGFWVVSAFALVSAGSSLSEELPRPKLIKLPFAFWDAMENTPVIYDGRPLLILNYRDDSKGIVGGYDERMYLYIIDLRTGQRIAEFGKGHNLVSGFVNGKQMNVFASQGTDRNWFKSIYRFWSDDLKTWKRKLAIPLEGDEHLLNSSVCRDEQGYLMAYSSNLPVKFCFKFARSKDLATWKKIDGLVFTGVNNECSACPVIRYFKPYYYVIYVHAPMAGHNGWIAFMARSKDLVAWQLSPMNPILEAGEGEGINNSDVDLFEFEGNTYLFYNAGTQTAPPKGWGAVRVAMYLGPMKQFFESCFPQGAKMVEVTAQRKPATN